MWSDDQVAARYMSLRATLLWKAVEVAVAWVEHAFSGTVNGLLRRAQHGSIHDVMYLEITLHRNWCAL